MPTIPENEFQDEELEQKVHDFITKKLEETKRNIHDLISHVKGEDIDVSSLEEIINFDLKEDQYKHSFVAGLKETARKLQREYNTYEFLFKSDTEVMDFIDGYCDQARLSLAAGKIFLYRELGYDVNADSLEAEIREICKSKCIKTATLDKIFKCCKDKPKKDLKASNDEIPEFEIYGYDEHRRVYLGIRNNLEIIPASNLKKELPIILGSDIDVEEVMDDISNRTSHSGRISTKQVLGQGIHLINENTWIIVSGKKAITINKDTFEREEIDVPLFDKYLINMEGEPWINLDLIEPSKNQNALQSIFNDLEALVSKWEWRNSNFAPYVTAYMMLTVFQQAMEPWRPIIYLSGEKGTGKTTFSNFFVNTFNGLPERIDKATPHAVRQMFGDNTKPGILDEFEHFESEKKQKDIMNLLKTSCAGGKVTYGTTGKHAKECYFHHLFWIASICFPKCAETDGAIRDRLVIFDLKKNERKFLALPSKKHLKALGVRVINAMLGNWNEIQKLVEACLEEKSIEDQMESYNVEARTIENYVWAHSLIKYAKQQEMASIVPPWGIRKKEDDADRILEEILHTKVKHSISEAFISDLIYQGELSFSDLGSTASDTRWELENRASDALNTLRLNHVTLSEIGDAKELHVGFQLTKLSTFFDKKELFSGLDIKTILSRMQTASIKRIRFGSSILTALLFPLSEINRILGRQQEDTLPKTKETVAEGWEVLY